MSDGNQGQTVALDLGSSSVRALVLDGSLDPVPGAIARRAIRLRRDSEGAAEVDADGYVDAAAACLDELRDGCLLDHVGSVVTASQWHSILAVDRDGRPRTPVLTWADTRPLSTAGRRPADLDAFHRRTGTWQHALYWTARIPWLTEQLGTVRVRFLGLPDYVAACLLDDPAVSLSVASGTGLLDLAARAWDEEALELAGITKDALPQLAPTGWAGRLTPDASRRWPQLAGTPWTAAIGDGAASSIGAGCSDEKRIAVTVGTSAAVRVVQADTLVAELPGSLWRYRVDDTRVVTGQAFSGGGNLFAWAADVLRGLDEEALETVMPGAHGLTSLPFHVGSRPPSQMSAGSGAIAGLGLDMTGAQMGAAVLEGVCHEVERGLRAVEETLAQSAAIVLNGGAVHGSPWWQRTFAAAFGRPVLSCGLREMAARGAALVARGVDASPPLTTVVPASEEIETMRSARDRYEALRVALTEKEEPT